MHLKINLFCYVCLEMFYILLNVPKIIKDVYLKRLLCSLKLNLSKIAEFTLLSKEFLLMPQMVHEILIFYTCIMNFALLCMVLEELSEKICCFKGLLKVSFVHICYISCWHLTVFFFFNCGSLFCIKVLHFV